MERSAITDSLSQLALFADLSRPQLEAVVHSFEEEVFPDGQRILRHGLSGGGFYVILEGEARVLIDSQERRRLSRGDFFGEIAALTGELPSADVVAAGLLRCFVIPAGRLEELLLERPQVMLRMLKAEARRVQTSDQWRE